MMNAIHPLRRWLFEHQTSPAEFARAAGVSRSHLSDLLAGAKQPSLSLIDKLIAATGGELTANDFHAHFTRLRECREKVA